MHYTARVTELRDLIYQEETRFKCVGSAPRVPGLLLTPPLTIRAVLTEIEEIRSGLWDERIKASLGIVSPEPAPDAPTAQEVLEIPEEPTNEIEDVPEDVLPDDVSMVDAEPPQQQDEPIIVDDSDATTDEPFIVQQVSQALEEEEVDLHLTPNSVPSSPKPAEGADIAQEQVEVTTEEPDQPVQKEAEPRSPSPFTEQDPGEQDAEGSFGPSYTLSGLLTHPRNRRSRCGGTGSNSPVPTRSSGKNACG